MMLVPDQDKSALTGYSKKGSLTEVDITEASTANLTPNSILVPDAKILEMHKSVTASNL